jgi:hypothetical protein
MRYYIILTGDKPAVFKTNEIKPEVQRMITAGTAIVLDTKEGLHIDSEGIYPVPEYIY